MSILTDGLDSMGILYTEDMLKKTEAFYSMLIEKNRVVNLTAITDHDDYIVKHILDSLEIASFVSMEKYQTVIDIGTGAGFPGIPLKIFFPEIKITLLDSLNKRLVFIQEVVDYLKLSDVEVVHGRAEDLAHDRQYREKYDLGVSRAVASLPALIELTMPFIRNSGDFIYYKGGDVEKEIEISTNAMDQVNCSLEMIKKIRLPFSEITHSYLLMKKNNPSPKKYPRKAGMPVRCPL